MGRECRNCLSDISTERALQTVIAAVIAKGTQKNCLTSRLYHYSRDPTVSVSWWTFVGIHLLYQRWNSVNLVDSWRRQRAGEYRRYVLAAIHCKLFCPKHLHQYCIPAVSCSADVLHEHTFYFLELACFSMKGKLCGFCVSRSLRLNSALRCPWRTYLKPCWKLHVKQYFILSEVHSEGPQYFLQRCFINKYRNESRHQH